MILHYSCWVTQDLQQALDYPDNNFFCDDPLTRRWGQELSKLEILDIPYPTINTFDYKDCSKYTEEIFTLRKILLQVKEP